ncbi:hypothetical protein [Nocardia sp. NPDC060249]|uniref:hypothetical protein n=1 Tax=Nocardia sp. NPDC060249 TaxID=3347082 RepID=UPI003660C4F2
MIRIVGVVLSAVLIMLVVLVGSRRRKFVGAATSSPELRVAVPTTRASPPRLTVELVPKTRWGTNLRSELSAREWKRLRAIVCEAAGNRCEICDGAGRRAPDCNEVWEYDDQQQIQRLVRLEALCAACHAVKHIGREIADGRGEQARSHLAEVNGWTPAHTDLYLEQQFEQWRARSEKEWTFDLAALSQYGPPLPPSTRRKRCARCDELFPPDQLTAVEVKRLLCEGCLPDESAGSK